MKLAYIAVACLAVILIVLSAPSPVPYSTIATSGFVNKYVQAGSITVTALETNKTITFGMTMPDVSYEVFFQPQSGLSTILWATSKTTTNCVMNLSLGVSGTLSYLIVQQ